MVRWLKNKIAAINLRLNNWFWGSICLLLIMAGTAGATDYYVDPDDGNDVNLGTSAALAWATLGKAADTITTGDRIFVEGPAGYEYTAQDDATNAILGLATNGTDTDDLDIQWIGCSDINDVNDGGIVVLDASDNTLANCLVWNGGADFNIFRNFHFKGGSGANVNLGGENSMAFITCRSSESAG